MRNRNNPEQYIRKSIVLEKRRRQLEDQAEYDPFVQEHKYDLPTPQQQDTRLMTASFAREFMKNRLPKHLQNSAIPSHPLMDPNILVNIWSYTDQSFGYLFQMIHPNLDYERCLYEFDVNGLYGFLESINLKQFFLSPMRGGDALEYPFAIIDELSNYGIPNPLLARTRVHRYYYSGTDFYPIRSNRVIDRYEFLDFILDLLNWMDTNRLDQETGEPLVDTEAVVEAHIEHLNMIREGLDMEPLIDSNFPISYDFVLYDTRRMVQMYVEALHHFVSIGKIVTQA